MKHGLRAALWPGTQAVLLCGLLLPVVLAATLGLTEAVIEHVRGQYGEAAVERIRAWQAVLGLPLDLTERDKLERVNHFFNRVDFVADDVHWKRKDYWATPVEMLASNGGDCEDYSIAKYFTLRELGVPEERLRITYVKAVKLNQAHMVLAYYATPGAEPLILDNLIDEIQRGSQRTDLVPVYSFNGDGLWLSVERGRGKRVGESKRVNLWTDLLERMQNLQQEVAP